MENNSGCLSQGSKIVGGILVAFIAISFPLSIVARSTEQVLFDPAIISQRLSQSLFSSGALRELMVEQLLVSASAGTEDELLEQLTAHLTEEDWRRISEIALPDLWMEEQVEGLTLAIFDWIDGGEVVPDLAVNVEPIKRRLLGEGSQEIVGIMVESWPTCSDQQVQAFEQAFRQGESQSLLTCQLPEPLNAVVLARITEEFQLQARGIPSTLDLIDMNQRDTAELLPAKSQIRQLRFVARWAVLVPLATMGLLMALVVRSWRGLGRWWGLPLAIGGGLTVLLALVLMAGEPDWVGQLATGLQLPDLLAASLERGLLGLRDQIVWRSAVWGLGLGVIGGAFLVTSLFMPGTSDNSIKLSRPPGGN